MDRSRTFLCCAAITLVLSGPGRIARTTWADETAVGFWTPKKPPRTQYKIDFAIRLAEKGSLQGTETIRFVNTTTKPIQTLAIDWSTARGASQTLQVRAHGKSVELASLESFPQTFVLSEPLGPGDAITLEVEFGVSMPVPSQIPEEIAISDWHPRLWWGCSSHSDYEVKLDLPEGFIAATSGRLDPDSGYYRIEKAPSFGLFLARNREVLKKDAGDVAILCLYKAENRKCAELLTETAADAIGFYRERFGFYPYRSLCIVPGMDHPAGGYPLATSIAVIHGMGKMAEKPELHWRWITAHEIGHQYWGRHVMEKDDPGWLWIGLGIYMDREYCRARNLGTDKHRELVARYINGVRQGFDTTVSRSQEEKSQIKFDFNNVVIHGKGFAIISALDCLLGKDTFRRVHARCLRELAGCRMGLSDFQAICEEESEQDLGWFFDQWVNSDKYVAYEIASQDCRKDGDAYTTDVQVQCLGTLKMPVPVVAEFEDGTSQQGLTNRLRDVDTVQFQSRSPLKQVRLDPDGVLPMIVPPLSPGAREVSQTVQELPWVGAGTKALDVFKKAKDSDSDYPDAGSWFKIGLTLYDGKYYSEAIEAFEKVESLGKSDPSRVAAAITWQGHLFDLLGQRDKAIERYKKALEQPAAPNVRHDQYQIHLTREWIKKRLEEPFRRE